MHSSALCLLGLAGLLQASVIPGATVIPEVGRSLPLHARHIGTNGGIIPPDGPDGIFTITFNPNNSTAAATITTVELFDGDATKRSESTYSEQPDKRATLPISASGKTQLRLDPGSYDQCTRDFGSWCDRGGKIGAGQPGWATIKLVRVGTAVAYGCNYSGDPAPCSSDEFNQANAHLDRFGWKRYETGWVWMESWAKGYGRVVHGQEICFQTAYPGSEK